MSVDAGRTHPTLAATKRGHGGPLHSGAAPAEATFRALLMGSVLGAILCAVNLHLGFKLGLGINLSIPAALFAYFGGSLLALGGGRGFSILETNLAQTAASAGAAVAATGLVTAVPALTITTGYQWTWLPLCIWLSALGALGVAAAVVVRRQLIEVEKLPFALGVATAGLLREIYDRSGNALRRLGVMLGAAVGGGALYFVSTLTGLIPLALPLAGSKANQFGWSLTLEPLIYAVGTLIGLRVALSVLLGGLIAYGWIGPFHLGLDVGGLKHVGDWLAWPGVAMLVVASLASLAGVAITRLFARRRWEGEAPAEPLKRDPREGHLASISAHKHSANEISEHEAQASALSRRAGNQATKGEQNAQSPEGVFFATLIAVSVILVATLQALFFGLPILLAVLTAAAAFLLAGVAGRVTGEVAVTPSGAMAKAAQLGFGLARPGLPMENLVAANVAGGSASQCGELIHDLKCGAILGASWRWQAIAQLCGTILGAVAGAGLYLSLYPDPGAALFTRELPAPAVKSLKLMAELLRDGNQALPPGAQQAVWIAAGAALLLAFTERLVPAHTRRWLPSPVAVGFGFLVPPVASLALAIGAGLAALVPKPRASAELVAEDRVGLNRTLVVVSIGVVLGQTFTELFMRGW